jgi:hypothetical protein
MEQIARNFPRGVKNTIAVEGKTHVFGANSYYVPTQSESKRERKMRFRLDNRDYLIAIRGISTQTSRTVAPEIAFQFCKWI